MEDHHSAISKEVENHDPVISYQKATTEVNHAGEPPGTPRSHEPFAKNEGALELGVKKDEGDSDSEHLHGFQLYVLLVALTLAGFLMMLNASVVATAIPKITSTFHSTEDIGWYGSAYLLANCAIQPLSGKIYARFPLKSTFVVFLTIFEVGSLICALSTSSHMFIVGRAVAGMGGSGIVNGALTMIGAAAPLAKRPSLIANLMAISAAGQLMGPLIGGALTQHVSWHWCFYINLPAGGLAALFVILSHVPRGESRHAKFRSYRELFIELDIIGFLIFAPAVIMFFFAIEWGGINYPWSSSKIIGLFCGSGVTATFFFIWEFYQGETAMAPFHMLRKTHVWCSCVTGLFQMAGLVLIVFYLPLWFQTIKNATPTMSGVMNLPTFISQIILALITGSAVTKFGFYLPWAVGGCVLTAIGSGVMSTFTVASGPAAWIGYQVLTGAGRGMVIQQPVTAVQAALPDSQIAVGSALVTFTQFFGAAIFVCLGETILTNALRSALPKYAPSVNVDYVLMIGATNLRTLIPPAAVPGVLKAYNSALTKTFYLAAGGASVAVFTAFGMGWTDVRKVRNGKKIVE